MFYSFSFVDINDCFHSPCVNGDCVDLQDGYQCNCEEGWTGQNCDGIIFKLVDIFFTWNHMFNCCSKFSCLFIYWACLHYTFCFTYYKQCLVQFSNRLCRFQRMYIFSLYERWPVFRLVQRLSLQLPQSLDWLQLCR